MPKPPKRPAAAKKPSSAGGRRGDRSQDRGERSRSEHTDRSSKRGSFRKREQDDPRKPERSGGREDMRGGSRAETRPPQKIPPREKPQSDRKKFEAASPREAKPARLKADLFGLHAVREAWQNPKRYVHNLYLTENALKEFEPFLKTAAKRPEPVIVGKDELDRAFPPGTVHQGVALSCQALAESDLMDIIIKGTARKKSVVVILDQVTDPHNIGAILRSACAFGADGVVMQSKHAPEMSGILAKTACGAMEHIDVAYETNLSRALEKLQEHHYTVIGLDEHADKSFAQLHAYDRVVIVLGAEGPGLRRLIRDHCDVLVKLPTQAPIASLNVSNAAAIALYALRV